ncbi:unnamed protein product [Discula destructiva]
MGTWTGFLLTYLLGGITFLPLLIAVVLLHAHLTLPYRDDVDSSKDTDDSSLLQPGDDLAPLKLAQKELKENTNRPTHSEIESAAGYYAVCREYTPMGINAKPIERSTPIGSTTVAAPSQSVYQSMYRSLFDRKQQPGPLDNGKSVRPKKGNVFYVVLRHGHLMLFDDDEQLEVRHVISLAHHDVSLYSGGDNTPEGELFIKRNAICLSRRTTNVELSPDTQLSKPFFLFSENCSAKEDFYFALLRNQEQAYATEARAPPPMAFDVAHIISLVQRLHSSEEHIQSRWLNAMIGRVYLGLYRTTDMEALIREKLNKKISRVKRPAFLSNIEIRKIDTGDAAPFFTNLRHRDLTVEGECSMEADVRYTGNFRIEVAAVARLDLGARLKAREVNLVLSVALRKLEGHILFKIKAPPSNRVWFSFSQMPKMETTIEPIVSSRQITYTVILRQIEARIKEVIAETLVLPFWDDTPFFNTEHKKWRGGIFAGDDAVTASTESLEAVAEAEDMDELETVDAGAGTPLDSELPPMEKSHSMPLMDNTPPTGLFGLKLGSRSSKNPLTNPSSPTVDSHTFKDAKAEAAATGIDIKQEPSLRSRSDRTSSFVAESTPIVGTDVVNAEFKPSSPPGESAAASAMAKLSARARTTPTPGSPLAASQRDSTLSIPALQSAPFSKESSDKEGSNDEISTTKLPRRGTASSTNSAKGEVDTKGSPTPSISGSTKSQSGSLTRGFFLKRDGTTDSTSTTTTATSSADTSNKRISLAAVSSAAGAAKRWGWNALHRNEAGQEGLASEAKPEPKIDLSKPMGGGRPLPPPGTPLPMPDKKPKTTSIPVPKRKPIPPPGIPDKPSTEAKDSKDRRAERRPVPPPPLPRRRRQTREDAQSQQGENLLVVEAPATDSEPTTPLPSDDGDGSYRHPFIEDAQEDDSDRHYQAGESSGNDSTDTPPALPERGERPFLSSTSSQLHSGDNADDDEFSAWMDNTGEEEPRASFVTSEGMAH